MGPWGGHSCWVHGDLGAAAGVPILHLQRRPGWSWHLCWAHPSCSGAGKRQQRDRSQEAGRERHLPLEAHPDWPALRAVGAMGVSGHCLCFLGAPRPRLWLACCCPRFPTGFCGGTSTELTMGSGPTSSQSSQCGLGTPQPHWALGFLVVGLGAGHLHGCHCLDPPAILQTV